MQAEKLCRARNAGIVVAHRLLALPGDLFRRPGRNLADKVPKIFLYPFLILRGWRNNLGRSDKPVLIEHVTMIEKAPWCFRGTSVRTEVLATKKFKTLLAENPEPIP